MSYYLACCGRYAGSLSGWWEDVAWALAGNDSSTLSCLPATRTAVRCLGVGRCRIVISASPPGVYPAVEFQDGDLRTKSSMVTRRRRDLDRFGPRCAKYPTSCVWGCIRVCEMLRRRSLSMGLPTSPLYRLGAVGLQGRYARVVLQGRRSVKIPRYLGL